MKIFNLLSLLTLLVIGCNKNEKPSSQIEENYQNKILGTWHNLNWVDSTFYLDGTFRSTFSHQSDTSLQARLNSNYMIFNNNGTHFTSAPQPSPTKHLTTYYNFISKDKYAETCSDIMSGQPCSAPRDTVTIKSITSSTMHLVKQLTMDISGTNSNIVRVHRRINEVWIR